VQWQKFVYAFQSARPADIVLRLVSTGTRIARRPQRSGEEESLAAVSGKGSGAAGYVHKIGSIVSGASNVRSLDTLLSKAHTFQHTHARQRARKSEIFHAVS